MLQILKAGYEDFETIHNMAKIVWPATYGSILSGHQLDYMFEMIYSKDAYNEQIGMKNHHFLIAKEDDGSLLGFASYECNYLSETTKIHKLYIMPDNQGKGVGKAFVNAIADIARRNNNDKLLLNVNRYNKAILFYEAIGFTKLREEDIDIGNGYLMEDYIMLKNI